MCIRDRLDVYERQTQPLIEYYQDKNLLSQVDGTKAINEVFESICGILGNNK
jgi:adenylate kinase